MKRHGQGESENLRHHELDGRAASHRGRRRIFWASIFMRAARATSTPAKARQIVRRLPTKVSAVGVFVNESEAENARNRAHVGLDASAAARRRISGDGRAPEALASGDQSDSRANNRFAPRSCARFKRASALLLDGFDAQQRGGTGKTFDWEIARRAKRHGRIFLAGGLTPENVAEAIRAARPYAVDVCSGVEARPGKKIPQRVKRFDARRAKEAPETEEVGDELRSHMWCRIRAAATARTAAATSRKR